MNKVDVLEKDGAWYKIKFKNKTGYVYSKYIKVDESKLKTSKKDDEKKEEIKEKAEETEKVTESKKDEEAETKDIIVKLYIKKDTNIRIIPNPISSIIYSSKEKQNINVIEQIGKWSYIEVSGTKGWVETKKLIEENAVEKDSKQNENEENKKETKIAYVKYSTVNLRKEPSTKSTSLAKMKLNNEVEVLEEVNSSWTKVKYGNLTGYVSSSLISGSKTKEEEKKEEETTSRSGDTASREKVESETEEEIKTKEETVSKLTQTKAQEKTEIKKEEKKMPEGQMKYFEEMLKGFKKLE